MSCTAMQNHLSQNSFNIVNGESNMPKSFSVCNGVWLIFIFLVLEDFQSRTVYIIT